MKLEQTASKIKLDIYFTENHRMSFGFLSRKETSDYKILDYEWPGFPNVLWLAPSYGIFESLKNSFCLLNIKIVTLMKCLREQF